MKILYIGYERAAAELAAGALHGITRDFTLTWAQSPGSGLEWLQDNRDAAAVIVEVHTQSCAAFVEQLRGLDLDTPVVVTGSSPGLVWAFLGGLLVDMLTPARPVGSTTFVLLVVVGLAAASTRFVGQTRPGAFLLVFLLTWVYHLLMLATLALTEGVTAGSLDLQHVLGAAVLNTILAIPCVALFVVIERRFGNQDRERAAWT